MINYNYINDLCARSRMWYGQKFAFSIKPLDVVKHSNKFGRFRMLADKVNRLNGKTIEVEYICLTSSNIQAFKPSKRYKVKHKPKTIIDLLKPIL